ncbi:MAG: hypothetical protein ACI8VW_001077 [bacterium]
MFNPIKVYGASVNLNKTSLAVIALCTLISGCSSSDAPEPPTDPVNDGIGNEDPVTPDSAILTPTAEAGSDTERLFKGINRQIARTILDLNASLRGGINLTAEQDTCLGSYDPAAGQQLLAINCIDPLTTGGVLIYVEQASYYDTAECHAAIFNGEIGDCFLKSAHLSIPVQWFTPERPADSPANAPNRPQPLAGIEVFYAINNSTNLRIESNEDEEVLTGRFQCDINLLTNETSATNQSCASTINLAANHFDTLLPD